jgi:hypothetical protein
MFLKKRLLFNTCGLSRALGEIILIINSGITAL